MARLKTLYFVGSSLDDLRTFPSSVRREAGHQLDRVQHGQEPGDWKPLKTVGSGVREIRIQQDSQYRLVYVAKFAESVYVLHAFQKKTQKTRKQDLEIARQRLKVIRKK